MNRGVLLMCAPYGVAPSAESVRTVHIEASALQDAEHWISRQRNSWEARLDRLSALADQMQRTKS